MEQAASFVMYMLNSTDKERFELHRLINEAATIYGVQPLHLMAFIRNVYRITTARSCTKKFGDTPHRYCGFLD